MRKLFTEKVKLDFNKKYGHLTDKEKTIVKVLIIVQKLALYGLFFSFGFFYGILRCVGV